MYESALQEIGLTKNEIKIYLALINFGRAKAGSIVKETKLHASKVYDSLERLIQKGLISYSIESGVKHFSCVDPARLKDYLEEKKNKIEKEEKIIEELIPKLKIKRDLESAPQSEIFQGIKGMKTAFEDILRTLKSEEEYYTFVLMGATDTITSFFDGFHRRRANQNIQLKIIVSDSLSEKRKKELNKLKLTKIKKIDSNLATPATFNVYSDKVLISLGLEKDPTSFLIKDKSIADSFRNYFEVLWSMSKD